MKQGEIVSKKTHRDNDRAVMQAYGFSIKEMSEVDCVAALMKLYQEAVQKEGKNQMADFKYEITEHIGVISESAKGWKKELNKISWNGAAPKYDIRDWSPDHEKMGKGVTLSEEEYQALKTLMQ